MTSEKAGDEDKVQGLGTVEVGKETADRLLLCFKSIRIRAYRDASFAVPFSYSLGSILYYYYSLLLLLFFIIIIIIIHI